MNRYSLLFIMLLIALLINGIADSTQAHDIKILHRKIKQTATEIGFLRGELVSYKVKNAKAWKAQSKFNKKVTTALGKIKVLSSPRFTIESQDE